MPRERAFGQGKSLLFAEVVCAAASTPYARCEIDLVQVEVEDLLFVYRCSILSASAISLIFRR